MSSEFESPVLNMAHIGYRGQSAVHNAMNAFPLASVVDAACGHDLGSAGLNEVSCMLPLLEIESHESR